MARRGFTLIEVLVAVMILATVCTAALKLVILSQNTLSDVAKREKLLDGAKEIEIGVLTGTFEKDGELDGLRWETEEKEAEMFGEDFGRLDFSGLDFDGTGEQEASETLRVKWRELSVQDEYGNSLTIYLESEEDAEKTRLSNMQEQKNNIENDNRGASDED